MLSNAKEKENMWPHGENFSAVFELGERTYQKISSQGESLLQRYKPFAGANGKHCGPRRPKGIAPLQFALLDGPARQERGEKNVIL